MAELVDAPASGAGARKGVEVRVLFRAPLRAKINCRVTCQIYRQAKAKVSLKSHLN
jgi:hypothetical protein